jgi:thioredoxin-like negative regulator of GroEL
MSSEALAAGGSGDAGAVEQVADLAGPLLVFFHSKLDGRSRRVEGFIAQVLQRRKNHGTFVLRHVDVEERADLAERFRISEVPTLLVVADRRVQSRLELPRGCSDIEAILKPWLR